MIWLAFIAIAAAGLAALLMGGRGRSDSVDPVAHYKAQLAEIDADEAREMIDVEGARAARIEVQRRLLKASKRAESGAVSVNSFLPVKLLMAIALSIALPAAGLYMLMGSPDVPAANPSPRRQAEQRPIEAGGPTLGEALAQIKGHLKENPDDMQGWRILASTARSVGDFATSARALGRLAEADTQNADLRVEQLEAYLAHARGQVTPAVRLVIAALLDTEPDHPAGQYYLGLARLQAGDRDGARAVWTALADRSAPDAPWMPNLARQLSELGVNPPALSREDAAMVDAMTDEEREAFLASMLMRLEARLESAPQDIEGWLMLARSKLALGDQAGAIAALEAGIAANPGQPSAQLRALLDNLNQNPDP